MANKLEDLVRVATSFDSLVGNPLYLEQKTKRASTTNTFEVFEALFYLRAFEVFETLFSFESLWSLWNSLLIWESLKSLKLSFHSRVFEVFGTLFILRVSLKSLKLTFVWKSHAQLSNKTEIQRCHHSHLSKQREFSRTCVSPPLKKQREFSTILPCSPFKTKTSFKACHGDHAKGKWSWIKLEKGE